MRCMATYDMVAEKLTKFDLRRLMQERGVPMLARLEVTWVQDTGSILEGSVNDKLIQLKRQSEDWN